MCRCDGRCHRAVTGGRGLGSRPRGGRRRFRRACVRARVCVRVCERACVRVCASACTRARGRETARWHGRLGGLALAAHRRNTDAVASALSGTVPCRWSSPSLAVAVGRWVLPPASLVWAVCKNQACVPLIPLFDKPAFSRLYQNLCSPSEDFGGHNKALRVYFGGSFQRLVARIEYSRI